MGDKPIDEWSVEEFAAHYADTMAKPANGWGQHCSDIFGQSHCIMHAAQKKFGEKEMCRAFGLKYRGSL